MKIRINGKIVDITLEQEKTVGEVMASLEKWLADSGHRLSGLYIDEQRASSSSLEEIFKREIDTINNIDITTSSIAELSAESLLGLIADIQEYEKLNFEEKNKYIDIWKERPQALFIAEQMPDLHSFYVNCFSGSDMSSGVIFSITEERLREVKDPLLELSKMQQLLDETCARLVDLALDIQTGKEGRAAQTIQIFSGIAEKVLRIYRQLKIQGYMSEAPDLNEKPITQIINGFGVLLNDLLEAYEKQDTVLVGDLAEYEAEPRLKELYTAILKNSRQMPETDEAVKAVK